MMLLNKIKAIIEGHVTVFKHSFKKRVTLEYPEIKQELPDTFRGKPEWSCEKCIACKICERVCPAGAIYIEKDADVIKSKIDLTRCIMCGNCMYYCPKKAVVLSKEYELAADCKDLLMLESDVK